ncbi:MAG TPA: type II secretion system F family protein [Candidatus Thermoplasmatota archaeon]|nr:type II secretion system F family protein [Candidatus Thermoplasmatota archaeon]
MRRGRPASPEADRWAVALALLGGAALIAGLLAWALDGVPRRTAILAVLVVSGALSLATILRRTASPDPRLAAAGYLVPDAPLVRVLHVLLTLLHNAGIIVVVYAALARFGALTHPVGAGAERVLPLVTGSYLLLLALACVARLREQGGFVRTWATRAHGIAAVGVTLGFTLVAAAVLPEGHFGHGEAALLEADAVVLALAAALGTGTQLFLALRLPTMLDLVLSGTRMLNQKPAGGGTPPIVHAAVVTALGTVVIGFLAYQLDVADRLGGFRSDRAALLFLLVPTTMALFFATSAFQIWRESRRGFYRQRVSTKLRNDLLVYGLSAAAGITSATLLFLTLTHRITSVGPVPADLDFAKDLIVLGIVATAGPIGMYLHREHKRVDHIEERLPDLLNDLAESRRAGLTMAAALRSASHSDYGALTPEVRKMAAQVGWGVSFTDVLQQFAGRVRTGLVERSVSLIIEASRTGGSVAEILKAAARDAYEIKALQQERRLSMLTYLIVIYVVFFVFLCVIAVLDVRFIPQVLAAGHATAQMEASTQGVSFTPAFDREGIRFVYFNAVVVQAVGNGLVGGVLSESRVTAGFRHVAIMAAMAWVVFRILLATA